MDIRSLPDHERDIYNRLKSQYSLHFKSLKINGNTIRLLIPSNMEELLGDNEPLADISSFPFWAKLWDSSIVLSHVLAGLPGCHGQRLLELGSGLGLSGLAASAAGFEVVSTDSKQIVFDFQKVSGAANNNDRITYQLLDWFNPPELQKFDVIGGAEILSNEEVLDPLLDICKNYLKKDGAVYLAHDIRRKSLPRFLEKAEREFQVGSKKQSIQRSDGVVDILVNRLQRK